MIYEIKLYILNSLSKDRQALELFVFPDNFSIEANLRFKRDFDQGVTNNFLLTVSVLGHRYFAICKNPQIFSLLKI